MRLAVVNMGKHFGELGPHIRGIVYYKLSPHEQKPFAKAFAKGIPNIATRTLSSWFTWMPPLIIGYLIYYNVELMHYYNRRKDPRDFANEVDNSPPEPPPPEPCPKGKKDNTFNKDICDESGKKKK